MEPCPSPLTSHFHSCYKDNKSCLLEQRDRAEPQVASGPWEVQGYPKHLRSAVEVPCLMAHPTLPVTFLKPAEVATTQLPSNLYRGGKQTKEGFQLLKQTHKQETLHI